MRLSISFLFILFSYISVAQDSTTVSSDSTSHSIKKAVILSAVVPGAGQIYNHLAMPKGQKKAYWKVPLIYSGIGAAGYFFIYNQREQLALKQEYINRENGEAPDYYPTLDSQGVLSLYNQHLTYRDLSILAFLGVYFIQVVDAGVEAHFVNFDVSDDLSLNIQPVIHRGFSPGVSLTLKFR